MGEQFIDAFLALFVLAVFVDVAVSTFQFLKTGRISQKEMVRHALFTSMVYLVLLLRILIAVRQ